MSEHVTRPRVGRLFAALSRRRRHRFAPVLLLLLALGATGGAYTALAPTPQAQATTGVSQASIDEGRALYLKNCSSCHGLNAEGATEGPSLIGVGAASVDFQVATGRMPAAQLGAQIEPKRNQFTDEEIAAMAAYIASLAPARRSRTRSSWTTPTPTLPRAARSTGRTAPCATTTPGPAAP